MPFPWSFVLCNWKELQPAYSTHFLKMLLLCVGIAGIQGLCREGLASAPLTLTHADPSCVRQEIQQRRRIPRPLSLTLTAVYCDLNPHFPCLWALCSWTTVGCVETAGLFCAVQSEANRKTGMLIPHSFPSSQLILGACGLGGSMSLEPAEGRAAGPWPLLWSPRIYEVSYCAGLCSCPTVYVGCEL